MTLNIWLMHHGESPPTDESSITFRTSRLAKELASKGHNVTYWMSSLWHHKKELITHEHTEYDVNGFKLKVLHAGEYKTNYSFRRYLHHHKMAREFAKEARKMDPPDIIVTGFPIHYCALESVKYGKEKNVPVVIDIRDFWPDVFLTMLPEKLQFLGKLLFAYEYNVSKRALTGATHLVSMMDTLLQWGIDQYTNRERTELDQVFYLGGDRFQRLDGEETRARLGDLVDKVAGKTVINYSGSFTGLNHPESLILAAKILNERGQGQKVEFVLAGHGVFHERCVSLAKGEPNIHFTGWVDAGTIEALNSISHIGVVPSIESATFPNKSFTYLGAGMPILYSGEGDLLDLIRDWSVGAYFDIDDPENLADELTKLIEMPSEEFDQISDNARKLFDEKLDAQKIYSDYASYVEEIARKGRT